jgi:hypothetical protein
LWWLIIFIFYIYAFIRRLNIFVLFLWCKISFFLAFSISLFHLFQWLLSLSLQVEEIVRAAGLDQVQMAQMTGGLSSLLAAKDEVLRQTRFELLKAQKGFNDSLEAVVARLRELGLPEEEVQAIAKSCEKERLAKDVSLAPAAGIVAAL